MLYPCGRSLGHHGRQNSATKGSNKRQPCLRRSASGRGQYGARCRRPETTGAGAGAGAGAAGAQGARLPPVPVLAACGVRCGQARACPFPTARSRRGSAPCFWKTDMVTGVKLLVHARTPSDPPHVTHLSLTPLPLALVRSASMDLAGRCIGGGVGCRAYCSGVAPRGPAGCPPALLLQVLFCACSGTRSFRHDGSARGDRLTRRRALYHLHRSGHLPQQGSIAGILRHGLAIFAWPGSLAGQWRGGLGEHAAKIYLVALHRGYDGVLHTFPAAAAAYRGRLCGASLRDDGSHVDIFVLWNDPAVAIPRSRGVAGHRRALLPDGSRYA